MGLLHPKLPAPTSGVGSMFWVDRFTMCTRNVGVFGAKEGPHL